MIVRPIRRMLRRLVRGAARRLPPPRGHALVATARSAFTLVTGRPTGRPTGRTGTDRGARAAGERLRDKRDGAARQAGKPVAEPLPKFARDELARAERAMREGRLTEVAQRTERLARELPENLRVLQLRADALAGAGDVAAEATALHRLHALRDDPAIRRRERVAAGSLVVTSPGWLPRIPGPSEPLAPAGRDVILYLVAASAPYGPGVETARLRANLASAVEAGLQPVIATGLGFPRSTGATAFARLDEVDGIPCRRLDLGPLYTLDRGQDRLLRDATWLLAGVVREVRPALLHAIPEDADPGLALVGLALRAHFGLPLVVEVAEPGPRSGTADETRREATLVRAVHQADRLVTAGEAARERCLAWGVDGSRIAVVPDAAVDRDHGSTLRATYEAVLAAREAMATA